MSYEVYEGVYNTRVVKSSDEDLGCLVTHGYTLDVNNDRRGVSQEVGTDDGSGNEEEPVAPPVCLEDGFHHDGCHDENHDKGYEDVSYLFYRGISSPDLTPVEVLVKLDLKGALSSRSMSY